VSPEEIKQIQERIVLLDVVSLRLGRSPCRAFASD